MYRKQSSNKFKKASLKSHIKKSGFKGRSPTVISAQEIIPSDAQKNKAVMQVYQAFKLRTAGEWSKDMFQGYLGKVLIEGHWDSVKKLMHKYQPKSKAEFEDLMKKIANTPQQRFVILHEASARGPLKPESFQEYFTLFSQLFPKHYKALYHNTTPAQLTKSCTDQMKRMGMGK